MPKIVTLAQIPFWLRGPSIAAGQVIKNPVLTIDIAPTLLELAGVATNTDMDGLSILPLVVTSSEEVALDFHTASILYTLKMFREVAYLVTPRCGYRRIHLTRPS